MSAGLTAEQLKRIEENKRKALAKRAEKLKAQSGNQLQQVNSTAQHNSLDSSRKVSSNSRGPADSVTDFGHADRSMVQHKNPSSTKPADVNQDRSKISDHDRIEQNRLKALAKRAEKLNKSPNKSACTTAAFNQQHSNQTSVKHSNNSLIANINKASISVINSLSSGGRGSNSSEEKTDSSSQLSGLPPAVSSNVPLTFQSKDTSNFSSNTVNQLSDTEKPQVGRNMFDSLVKGTVKGKCVLVSRDRFSVEIGYSSPLIQCFKTMETKLYDAVTKKWSFRLVEYNKFMSSVTCLKPAVDVEPLPRAILQAFESQLKGGNPVRTVPIADLSRIEQTLVNSLMSFQREGVNFGVYKNGRVLIADDMGLGKTIQAICLACYFRLEWPLLVVVPSSVRFDWAQQIQRWVPSLDPQSINVAVTGKDNCTSGLVNIISYDLMARQADKLKAKRFQVIIMDECHLLKNYKTARCKVAMPLLQIAKRVIMLSGTPALSRPSELYTQISAICPYLFKFHDFGVRYCDGKKTNFGWDYSGSSNMEELQLFLEEKIMIRRLKKDVLSELPDKVRQMVQLDPSFIKVDKGLQNASKIMGKLKKTEERGALLDFFHKSGIAKIKAIKNYVLDLLEGEKKFIIFAHHGDVLDEIEATVQSKIDRNYVRIDGKTGSEQRNVCCKKFQHSDSIRVAILSITAANAGLNMSAANLVVFAELFWNPGILVQAEDRAHRIGQQDSVSVHYLVATGTSDDHIWPMIQKKLDVLGKAGLTKDNFSSAETTQFLDPQQEQITKFLEESFSMDMEFMNQQENEEEDIQPAAKPCVTKQKSILHFTSPVKDLPKARTQSNCTPTKRARQRSLFQYYSPSKAASCHEDQGQVSKGQGQEGQGHLEDEFLDDDFDELLTDTDWDVGVPPNKKKRT